MIDEFNIADFSGEAIDGNWDTKVMPFEDRIDFYSSFKSIYEGKATWNETPYYQRVLSEINSGQVKWGCTTEQELIGRCNKLTRIFVDIKGNGYRQDPAKDYVAINIGRNGEMIFNNGRHRLVFARLLNIPTIPVKITVEHSEWKQFRDKIIGYAKKHDGVVYAPLIHPDLKDIPSMHSGRFESIKRRLNPAGRTVLDIGTHWGYMCSQLERECGRECFAIENGKGTFYYLERIRKANGQRYHTIFADIFDYVEQNRQFDTVLALAIFHHFIKTEELHQKLCKMLGQLKMKEMFLQAHKQDENQMKTAYRNYSPTEFAQFIIDNSCLTAYKEIGDFEGRKLFHIYIDQAGNKDKAASAPRFTPGPLRIVPEPSNPPAHKRDFKLLFLGFVNATYPQILHKIFEQYRAMKKIHPQTELLLIGKGDDKHPTADKPYQYLDVRTLLPKPNFLETMELSTRLASMHINRWQPDYIYLRYPLANRHTVDFVKRHKNIIVEYQSNQIEEFKSNAFLYKQEIAHGKEFYANIKAIAGGTRDILTYESELFQTALPGFVFPNGIDVASYPLIEPTGDNETIHVIYLSMFTQLWQGFDRIIDGIANYKDKDKVMIHVIGNVDDEYFQQIKQRDVARNFRFYGVLHKDEITGVINRCSVGIGALAIHRKGQKEVAALKLREYCARGIPFVFAGNDPDFPRSLPFVHQYPLNDEPLDIAELVKLAENYLGNPELKWQIRDYAEQKLDWGVKMKALHEFISGLADDTPLPCGSNDGEISRLAAALKQHKGDADITQKLMRELLRPQPRWSGSTSLVSIVIPYYKQPDTIIETLASIRNQSYQNFEIIIVNDGDSREVEKALQKFSAEAPELSIDYYFKSNEGLAATRNYGISKARGRYILPLDSDDLLAADFLKQTVAYLDQRPDVDFVYTEALFFGAKNEIWAFRDFDDKYLKTRNMMTCTTLFRKEVWQKCNGYKTNMKYGYEDWDFWLTAIENGFNGGNIHQPLFLYRRKNNSMLENRGEYDALAKAQIIGNHPRIYKQDTPDSDQLLKQKIGLIPTEMQITKGDKNAERQPIAVTSKKKPRILFVCHNFPPHKYGGAQLYALNLAKKIKDSGFADVEILYPLFRGEIKQYGIIETEFEGLKVFQLAKDFSRGFDLAVRHPAVAEIFDKFLQMRQYDAIHFHGFGQLTPVPIEIAQKHNLRTIMTLHEHWFLCFFWFLMTTKEQKICSGPDSIEKCTECVLNNYTKLPENKKNYQAVSEFIAYRFEYFQKVFHEVDRIFAPSHFLADKFAEYGFTGITVQNLGMKPIEILPKRREQAVKFGIIGQISPRKGTDTLLDVFESMKHKDDAKLLIYGKSYHENFFANIQKRVNDLPNVQYLGAYTPEDLPKIMANIDVLIVPSIWENYPLVVQEAFLCKVPVIASDVGGFPEVIEHGHNGLLFEVGSAEELGKQVETIIADPSLIEKFSRNIKPVRSLDEDALFYFNEYMGRQSDVPAIGTPAKTCKVQFYVFKNVHFPMFEELYNYLKSKDEVEEIIFCLPHIENLISASNYDLIDHIFSLGATVTALPRRDVDVTFIADTVAGKVKGCGKIVNVGHGTISKGYYFTNSVWTERENWVDLLCVPGQYAEDKLKPILKTKVVATGMAKLDPVFRGEYSREQLCRQLGLDERKKLILYAPTFNLFLSSLYNFADRMSELHSQSYYVLFKLHGSSMPRLIQQYRDLAQQYPNFIYIEDNNIAPYIGGCDLMISDVSSASMEFMALDKPVILYNNPERKNYHGYNPDNIEYLWRDLATEVDSFDELKAALPSLLNGDDRSAIRQRYAQQLFADRTGNAAHNIWQATKTLTDADISSGIPQLSVVQILSEDNLFAVRQTIHFLQFYSVMPMELLLGVESRTPAIAEYIDYLLQFNSFSNIVVRDVDANAPDKLVKLLKNPTGRIVIYVDEAAEIYKNYDYFIYKSFSHHPEIKALTGLTLIENSPQDARQYIPLQKDVQLSAYAYFFINKYQGTQCVKSDQIILPLLWAIDSKLLRGVNADNQLFLSISRDIYIARSLFYSALPVNDFTTIKNTVKQLGRIPLGDRVAILKNILDSYLYPDIAQLLTSALHESEGDFRELVRSAQLSVLFRFHDAKYKERLLDIVGSIPEFKRILSKDVEITQRLSSSRPQAAKRALFYFFKNVHIPVLMPVYRELKEKHPEIEIGFSLMKYAPEIRAGFTEKEKRNISMTGETLYESPQVFSPDITFIADSVYPLVQDCGKIVNIGHGALSKGQYYTDTPVARREEAADLVCVPGSYHRDVMRKIISKPVIATGMAKLDDLFSGKIDRQSVIEKYQLPAAAKYILFAPTFNDELSAIPFVGAHINDVIPDSGTLLIVKCHNSTARHHVEMFRELVTKDRRVILAEEEDITPFLALCDIIITDVSSAMMEFAALDKPVILFNSPDWRQYKGFNPADIDFSWRDIGIEVSNLTEMKEAVAECFANPDAKSELRNKYSAQLFANKETGDAAEKIVEAALSLN